MTAPADAEFSVSLNRDPKLCAATGCHHTAATIATLAWCLCADQPTEHGHPGSPEATRREISLCAHHGALVAEHWESYEGLRSTTAGERGVYV